MNTELNPYIAKMDKKEIGMPESSDDQNRNHDQVLIEQIRDRFREVESLIESMKSKLPNGDQGKDL